MVGILTSLCHCKLGLTKLDAFGHDIQELARRCTSWLPLCKEGCWGVFLLLKQTFLKPTKKNWTNLVTLRMICNCCNIFLINMDMILTCFCNFHFEF